MDVARAEYWILRLVRLQCRMGELDLGVEDPWTLEVLTNVDGVEYWIVRGYMEDLGLGVEGPGMGECC